MNRMLNSARAEILLGAGHEVSLIFRIDWLATSPLQLVIAVLLAISLLPSVFIGPKLLTSVALAAVLIVTIAIALLGTDPISIEPTTLFLVPAFTCLGDALAITFLVLPHLFALGSNLNYWSLGPSNALFWMLAVVAFLSPLAQQGRGVASCPRVRVNDLSISVSQVRQSRSISEVYPLRDRLDAA